MDSSRRRQAEKVRLHLATCAVCQEELGRLLQLKALAQDLVSPVATSASDTSNKRSRAFRPRWHQHVRRGGLAVLAMAMASAALILMLPRSGAGSARRAAVDDRGHDTRDQLRSSYPGAHTWRPYETTRGAPRSPGSGAAPGDGPAGGGGRPARHRRRVSLGARTRTRPPPTSHVPETRRTRRRIARRWSCCAATSPRRCNVWTPCSRGPLAIRRRCGTAA